MKEWPDEWTIVSNDRGVWVAHMPSGQAWRLAPASALQAKDDRLAQTYREVMDIDD